jgi:aryl-alcohol dehydrogenase-like predicted oxidoreductase
LWVLSAGESGSPADRRYAGLALIGLSGASQEMLARAQQMTPIAAVQNRFHLLDRSGVQVLADCEAQGIMFVPHFPLAWLLRRSPRHGRHPRHGEPRRRWPRGAGPADLRPARGRRADDFGTCSVEVAREKVA